MKAKICTWIAVGLLTAGGFAACDDKDFPEQTKDEIPKEVDEQDQDKEEPGDDNPVIPITLEDIEKTLPLVNRYLDGLDSKLNKAEREQALVEWFKTYPGVIDAWIVSFENSPYTEVAFSCSDGEITRELILDFSSTHRVLSYHYDVAIGAYVKTKKGITIRQVFDFINNADFEVKEIIYGDMFQVCRRKGCKT